MTAIRDAFQRKPHWRRLRAVPTKSRLRQLARTPWFFITRRNLLSTRGRCVELIGPAGVGKTSLLKQVWNDTSGDWHSRNDLAGAKINQPPDLIDSKIHWRLLVAKSQSLESAQLSGLQKLKLMSYFSKVLLNDVVLRNTDSTKGFFLDEGLCHNFSRELVVLEKADFSDMMFGRALVFLKQRDDRTLIHRIKKRTRVGGHMVPHHHGKTDDELGTGAAKAKIRLETLAARAEAISVPLCIIHAEDPIEAQIQVLLEFERRLVKQ